MLLSNVCALSAKFRISLDRLLGGSDPDNKSALSRTVSEASSVICTNWMMLHLQQRIADTMTHDT